jgi:hypothetical protein
MMQSPFSPLANRQLFSIGQINNLPHEQMVRVYSQLLPPEILQQFDIDPATLADEQGHALFECRPGILYVKLSLYHVWQAADPVLYVQLADTPNNQIEVVLLIVNDPHAERFDTDRMPDGTSTFFSTLARNVAEEVRAMKAGLAPGQVRHGLGLTPQLIATMEQFATMLHHDAFYIQPLAYHNATLFERLGFAYQVGLEKMKWIDREFAPGGTLFKRLDGSTPFRQPGAERSVRGRSWAIHDGILGEAFTGIKMYKRVGVHAGVSTVSQLLTTGAIPPHLTSHNLI